MKNRQIFALSALALATRLAFAADPASVSLVLFDQKEPVPNAEVIVDGQPVATTSEDGAVHLSMEPGKHRLEVMRDSESVVQVELDVVEDESAEIIATLYPDSAPSIFIESSNEGGAEAAKAEVADGPPGILSGRVINAEDRKPIAGAQVFVSGMPIDVRTGEDGSYTLEVPAGKFSVSIVAPQYATQTKNDVEIASEQTTTQDIELTPSGVELPEFVVIEPFVEGSLASFVEEKRTSAAVTDVLGAEQISRNGDSDAAGALKRVTGLTLVDGKFVYIRGLGERYSSTLLNGATVPSPDPTRRVVPLDLFPTTILQGITVQKTYSADMPGEFGGGVVQLRTRGVPESFLLKASLGYTYIDGVTGEQGLRSDGSSRDWTGRDDGFRQAPLGLLNPPEQYPSTDTPEGNQMADALLSKGMNFYSGDLGPSGSASLAVGDKFDFGDGDWSLGYVAAVRYAHKWDNREEDRFGYNLSRGELRLGQKFKREETTRNVDISAYAALGLKVGEHHDVMLNFIDLSQTTDEVQFNFGDIETLDEPEANAQIQWIENSLQTVQATGEHSFPALNNLFASWQVTDASASRYSPFTRQYVFEAARGFANDRDYVVGRQNNYIIYDTLGDDSREYRLDLKLPISLGDDDTLTFLAGATQLERARDSVTRRFEFKGNFRGLPRTFNPGDTFNPTNVGGDAPLSMRASFSATDSYQASIDLQSYYLASDLVWDEWRLNLGARQEDYAQQVITKKPFSTTDEQTVGGVSSSDLLPAGSLTWAYSEKAQFRLGYSETVARPDLREQSTAQYRDPLLDIAVSGNPDLKPTAITSMDARWEYYFSPTESISLAYFQKEFTYPIELVARPASGNLLGIVNADSAVNSGWEIDYYKSFDFVEGWKWLPKFMQWPSWKDIYLSANYAKIQSEIELGERAGIATNSSRPLQGQSPYVANVSLSYLHPEGQYEGILLYNVFGERIERVGESGVPDIYEQPFHQLDFNFKAKLPWDGWTAKLRVKNILDGTSRSTAENLPTREYKKGREFGVTVEWKY